MFFNRIFKALGNFILLALVFSTTWVTPARAAGFLYVTSSGTGDCSSWATACTLQIALSNAVSGDEIWVAAGTYKPIAGTDRTLSFQLVDGVAIYGGFVGTETARDQRAPVTNITILSGDIDNDDSQTPIITDLVTVTGNATNSYHVVTGANNAILDGFTITAGNANGGSGWIEVGGGIFSYSSNPTLANITFSGNSAGKIGGGMYNYSSSPQLTNVTFNNNSAVTNGGGGMYNYSGSSPTLTDVTFTGNLAIYGSGMVNDTNSNPLLTNVTFSNNTATNYGGGMYNYSSSPLLTNVTFNNNSAVTNGGGGMYNYSGSNPTLTDVTFTGNLAIYGGGMVNDANSNPLLTNVTFSSNTATNLGGGMYNYSSSPTLTAVTFNNNSAVDDGGGMYNYSSSPILTNVTFSGNSAVNGGGGGMINNSSSSPVLINVTFSGNTATIYGGAILNDSSNPALTNVTFASNTADWGSGMVNFSSSPQIHNTIFWGNTSPINGAQFAQIYNYDVSSAPNVSESILQGGCSAESVCTNILTTDPKLGALADHGGFTQTISLLAGSSAINALPVGANGCGTTITADQRGVARPQGALCDIGAYEDDVFVFQTYTISGNAGSAGVTLSYIDGSPKTVIADASGLYTITVPHGWSGTITPTKTDYTFLPPYKPYYVNVSSNWIGENYSATAHAPGAFTKSSPGNGLNNTGWTVGWNASSYVTTYEYCYGVSIPCGNWTSNGSARAKFLSDLVPGTTYYWQVRARNSIGTTDADSGNHWSFLTNTAPFSFNKTSPTNGIKLLSPPAPNLTWEISRGASSYEYCFSYFSVCAAGSVWTSVGGGTNVYIYNPYPLTANGGYYWQVRAVNAYGTTYANGNIGSWWVVSFPLLPSAFNKSGPYNGATNQSINPTLSWGSSIPTSIHYEYCYDTSNDNACTNWVDVSTAKSVTLSNLLPGTTYYWQVRAVNGGIAITYAEASATSYWSFKTGNAPVAFNKSGPANGAINQPVNLSLSWGASSGATSYQYCYDTTNDNACSSWVSNGTANSKALSGLQLGATYYWQVRAVNSYGNTYSNGAETSYGSFTIGNVPGAFNKTSPSNGATEQALNGLALQWGASSGAISYEYCYDTINDGICSEWINNDTSTGEVLNNLSTLTTYYWHVRAKNEFGVTYSDGNTWSAFTTRQVIFTSTAVNDGWTLESSEFSNLASTKSASGTLRAGDDARNRQYRSLLYFDTASLPNNAVITNVTVQIKQASVAGTPITTLGNLVADIKKGFFGLAPLELTDFNAAAAPINTAGMFKTSDNTVYQLTLSSVNFKYINLTGTTQFRLRFTKDDDNDKTADFINFYAGDAALANQPQLIVEYYIP